MINRSENNRSNNSPFERNRSVERPSSNDNNRAEPVRERPVITRPAPVERERPTQIERPQRVERSLPAPRSAPERPTYNNGSSAPQRAPQNNGGSSSNGGGLQRGGRPAR